jgi:hypothetical protein
MGDAVERLLLSPKARVIAAAITLAIGLVFTFVWAPHPWGWRGIDQYHQLAVSLAHGEPFGTTDVPWAYAYYVAAFYALFGEHAWIPVVVQVFVNAAVPLLLYAVAAPLTSRRTAALAALLIGVFSFNTVYASTQSSDALCTVTFLGALVFLARAYRTGQLGWYAASGVLSGLMPQFRPNLILLPVIGAIVILLLAHRRQRALVGLAIYLTVFATMLAPWTVRNYRLTETFLPTSSHGGVQLWYGSLQTGQYLESRAHNPRSVFETPAFDYFSIAGPSIIVSAAVRGCAPGTPSDVTLAYRTDRDSSIRKVAGRVSDGSFTFEIPGQPQATVIYYWFQTTWPGEDASVAVVMSPAAGADTPYVFTVSDDHLGDLDIHHDLFDVFDVVRLASHLVWGQPVDRSFDLDASGSVDDSDLARLVTVLVPSAGTPVLVRDAAIASLRFQDESVFEIPRAFTRVTDLAISGDAATALSYARVPRWRTATGDAGPSACQQLENTKVNEVFYRREPHMMRRYTALALDNISRDPLAFAMSSLYRAGRLFVIRGTSDQLTTQQFESSRAVYMAGTVLSAVYLVLFTAGVVISMRRRSSVLLLLLPILYVPATICFVLTNMRYTITVQPLMFVFVAVALLAALDRAGAAPSVAIEAGREG